MTLTSIGTPTMWVGFIILVLIVLAIDLWGLGGKTAHRVSQKEALTWTIVWNMPWKTASMHLTRRSANLKR